MPVCCVPLVSHTSPQPGNCSAVISHLFAPLLSPGLGPGDETIVLRIVDGVLLPHLCSPSALSRALGRQEIFHLGGGDSAEAAQAVRDYYLHWLKRLLTTEGEGVLPLSVALWTHQHAAIHTLTRPLKSAYLPLPRDFLFLPLAIALKAANQEADAHLATPEFRRASTMALSIVLVLLLQHRASASCATASSPRAGNGDGLGLLLVGRGGKGGESIGGARGGAGEALFCKSASVYLLGSDVYLHDSVAVFLRSAFATLLPPSWQCISDRDSDGGSAGLGGDGSGGGGAVGLDLSKKSVADLQLGKLFAALASQFTQDSFGDVSLSQMLLLALQAHLPPEWRIEVLCLYLHTGNSVCVYMYTYPCTSLCLHMRAHTHTHTRTHTHTHTHTQSTTDMGNAEAVLSQPSARLQGGPRRRNVPVSMAPGKQPHNDQQLP